ncbi:hypothetical protein G9C98_002564 [Cotesia typhae]|uniref:Golgi to ER traffic protein 4 homolog n=1 Tax=Cotesia typhae TaxID=2053667 RepID=A0A8J5R7F9_9HYME|nr:hypothetical protein G9C98_002564 [Cotesia typhae]
MASRYNQGIQRVLGKLEASVNSGNYYEAHQMYRTLYFRYLAKKKYMDLLELLYNGSILLLQRDQHASGADLGILFIDVLNKAETTEPTSYFEKITNLFSIMKPSTPERETFLHNALRWSLKHTNCKWGHPELHKMIAQVFWQAQEAFDSYTSRHPKINNEPPYLLPLLNFLFFLLKTIQLSSFAAFTVLCEQYQLSLNRDPSYRTYLDKIAQLFFDVPAPRSRRQGLFGSLLQSFFNGLEDDESDGEETSRQASNNPSTSHAVQELD